MSEPERTCIGCRGRDGKTKLLRLVRRDSELAADPAQREPGRGAYLHRRGDCVNQAVRRRAVSRAFRTGQLDGASIAGVVAPYLDIDPEVT